MSEQKLLLKFFLDKACFQPIPTALDTDGKMIPIIQFVEIVDVGNSAMLTLYMKNVSGDLIDSIKLNIRDSDVAIKSEKTILKPQEVAPVIITWSPSMSRGKTPLNHQIDISARIVI